MKGLLALHTTMYDTISHCPVFTRLFLGCSAVNSMLIKRWLLPWDPPPEQTNFFMSSRKLLSRLLQADVWTPGMTERITRQTKHIADCGNTESATISKKLKCISSLLLPDTHVKIGSPYRHRFLTHVTPSLHDVPPSGTVTRQQHYDNVSETKMPESQVFASPWTGDVKNYFSGWFYALLKATTFPFETVTKRWWKWQSSL